MFCITVKNKHEFFFLSFTYHVTFKKYFKNFWTICSFKKFIELCKFSLNYWRKNFFYFIKETWKCNAMILIILRCFNSKILKINSNFHIFYTCTFKIQVDTKFLIKGFELVLVLVVDFFYRNLYVHHFLLILISDLNVEKLKLNSKFET